MTLHDKLYQQPFLRHMLKPNVLAIMTNSCSFTCHSRGRGVCTACITISHVIETHERSQTWGYYPGMWPCPRLLSLKFCKY